MHVSIDYGNFKFSKVESNRTYLIQEPHIDIHIQPNKSFEAWHNDTSHDRTLRIIKIYSEKPHCGSDANSVCDHTIKIILLTPDQECTVFDTALEPLKTCSHSMCTPPVRSNYLHCSPQEAHLALDAILRVSNEFFSTQDRWLADAKKFIDSTPSTTKQAITLNPALEAAIRRVLGKQQGAINLLEDLKAKPFNYSVELILKCLLFGMYGNFTSDFIPEDKLSTDLKKRGLKDLAAKVSQGRYNHFGPKALQNFDKLRLNIKNMLSQEQLLKLHIKEDSIHEYGMERTTF